MNRFSRLELLIGKNGLAALENSHVAIIGLGAVGSFAAEALARSGVGRLTLIDCDVVGTTNINRQLFALSSTIGEPKVFAAVRRLQDINPELAIQPVQQFYHHDTAEELLAPDYDFLIDAIDGVSPKIDLICRCRERSIPFISAMGAAGRKNPGAVGFADLSETSGCPLCRVMRKSLKHKGIREGVPVVFSREPVTAKPLPPDKVSDREREEHLQRGRQRFIQPSAVFMPGIFGLLAAQYAIDHLLPGSHKKTSISEPSVTRW
ncbi:MAG: tRNA threonylcarbamoyladenosine dehydratase [Deltaproteobacteria bacterium]|nr:tRNA threonylcarbamoyladenosine dehydratase [Candidatus Anaeroferrophillus wilburensis]MBN2888151.1 tRNA threonylcarbamoyladenosine dehydratase [Deltaproteobacteria bacterium]